MHVTANRWENWMLSGLSLSLSPQSPGEGSALLLSRGRKYGSCQGPYDAASALCTWRPTTRSMPKTQKHKELIQSTLNCKNIGFKVDRKHTCSCYMPVVFCQVISCGQYFLHLFTDPDSSDPLCVCVHICVSMCVCWMSGWRGTVSV